MSNFTDQFSPQKPVKADPKKLYHLRKHLIASLEILGRHSVEALATLLSSISNIPSETFPPLEQVQNNFALHTICISESLISLKRSDNLPSYDEFRTIRNYFAHSYGRLEPWPRVELLKELEDTKVRYLGLLEKVQTIIAKAEQPLSNKQQPRSLVRAPSPHASRYHPRFPFRAMTFDDGWGPDLEANLGHSNAHPQTPNWWQRIWQQMYLPNPFKLCY